MRRATPLLLLLTTACGGEAPAPSWPGTVVDSAGVAIVANPSEPLWGPDERWSVIEDLVIVPDEARPETLFGYVADLAVDAQGRIHVLDQQAQAVRTFGPDGTPSGSIGGPGEGPGELGRFAFSLLARGDTLLVVDWGQVRLSRFSTDGAFLSAERLPVAGAARSWWVAGPEGPWLRTLERYLDDAGRWRGRDLVQRYLGPGATDTVATLEYAETDLGGPQAPLLPLVVNAPAWTPLPDGRLAWLALEEGRLRIHGADGSLERIVTGAAWERRAPTAEDIAALEEKMGDKLEMLGGSRDALRQVTVVSPATLPAVTSVLAGPEGTIWVQRMGPVQAIHPMALNSPDPPTAFGGATWDVLDAEGRWLGPVELPAAFRLMRLTDEALYGVGRDAFDADRVVRLRLIR